MPTANHRIRALINDLKGAFDRVRGVSASELRRAEYLLDAGRLDLLLAEGIHARMLRARRGLLEISSTQPGEGTISQPAGADAAPRTGCREPRRD